MQRGRRLPFLTGRSIGRVLIAAASSQLMRVVIRGSGSWSRRGEGPLARAGLVVGNAALSRLAATTPDLRPAKGISIRDQAAGPMR